MMETTFPSNSPYRRLARSLDALPNGFPPAADETDLKLLAFLYSPAEADLASSLLAEIEPPAQIAARLGRDPRETGTMLKEMARKGLIRFGKNEQGRPGFGLLPFVVGIYEDQNEFMSVELARLFEDYYRSAFGQMLSIQPQVHRIIPVGENIKNNMEVHPYESASGLIGRMKSWGVINCICRMQKQLIGQGCSHPVEVCMVLSDRPDAFAGDQTVRALTEQEALQTLRQAAEAGLVHCVSNNQQETWYICNCCTCSCAILRGMADLGIANVVARSAFTNRVNPERCIGCGACVAFCQFNALKLDDVVTVNEMRCVGCGICVPACPQGALGLERRPDAQEPPLNDREWGRVRSAAREE